MKSDRTPNVRNTFTNVTVTATRRTKILVPIGEPRITTRAMARPADVLAFSQLCTWAIL